jgi:hypothetical protein
MKRGSLVAQFTGVLLLFCSMLFSTSLMAQEVVVNTTIGKDGVKRTYYHLKYTLTPDNSTLVTPKEWLQCHYSKVWGEPINPEGCWCNRPYWVGNGTFVIYLKQDLFPILSDCKSDWLKLRMKPNRSECVYEATEAALAHALESKRELWLQIVALHEGKLEQLEVILELNPYVTVLSESPLRLKLDHCNLYFRTADNAYIDHLNAVEVNKSQP